MIIENDKACKNYLDKSIMLSNEVLSSSASMYKTWAKSNPQVKICIN